MSFFNKSVRAYARHLFVAAIFVLPCVPKAEAQNILTGVVRTGTTAIGGADVQVWAAGTRGYGSAGLLLATTQSANDGSFSFEFFSSGSFNNTSSSFVCPFPTSQLYLTSTGGQANGMQNNPQARFLLAVGTCGSFTANANVGVLNEVTTVATMAALQQYFNPSTDSEGLGYPTGHAPSIGFANGQATLSLLANVQAGTAITTAQVSAVPAGTSPTGIANTENVTVTVAPETPKVRTLANLLEACVKTAGGAAGDGSPCGLLYAAAVPPPDSSVTSQVPTYATATDTLQALYYLLVNPDDSPSNVATGATNPSNIQQLFTLQTVNSSFKPALTAVPTDWTIGIYYNSTTPTCAGGAAFLQSDSHIAVGAVGNLWMSGAGASGGLLEMSPTGLPITCTLGKTIADSTGLTIDTSGNVWVAPGSPSTKIYEYSPSSASTSVWNTGNSQTGSAYPQGIAADGNGNVFFTTVANNTTTGTLLEYLGAASATAPVPPVTLYNALQAAPLSVAIDTAGNVWTADGSSNSLVTLTTVAKTGAPTQTTTNNVVADQGLSIGLSNVAYAANSNAAGSSVSNLVVPLANDAGRPAPVGTDSFTQFEGGAAQTRGGAVDGAGNVWLANLTAESSSYSNSAATNLFAITELSAQGAPLSPNYPSATSAIANQGGFQKSVTILPGGAKAVAIDLTGNVWVSQFGGASSGITELVGAAVPVITPVAADLAAGMTSGNAVTKPGPGYISVTGNHLTRDGVVWTAHGVVMVAFVAPPAAQSGVFSAAYKAFSLEELEEVRAWGADTIRFQVSQPGLDPQNTLWTQSFVDTVKNAVLSARSIGLNVIVSVQDEKQSGETSPTPLPNAATKRVWQELAPLFNGDRGILYEILNEPQPVVSNANWADWLSAMNTVITAIRLTGSQNVVVVDGLQLAEYVDGAPSFTDPLVAYADHPYFHSADDQNTAFLDSHFGTQAANAPVIITEWYTGGGAGSNFYCDANTPTAALNLLQYLETNGVGLTAFAFDAPAINGSLTTDFNGTSTTFAGGLGCGDNGFGFGTITQIWYQTGAVPTSLK